MIRALANDRKTLVVVTHELGFAREVEDTLAFIDGGIVAVSGDPEETAATQAHRPR